MNKEKIAGKKFNNIFIVVIAADIEARAALENDLTTAAIAKDYKIVKSVDVMPPSFKDPETPTKEDIKGKVISFGCDGVFVASLLKKEESIHYTPGVTTYTTRPFYLWQGNYYDYYSNFYPTVSSPGYYNNNNTYFMQSNLYDVASEEIMWSVQSKVFHASS